MNPHRFFLYARKSTDDTSRQIRSIDDQIAELRELARKEGFEIVEELIEKQTAKIPGRPVFNSMLDRIEQGEATGILAWHPDRLARNSLDAGRIIWFIDTGKLLSLKFPNVPFENTASGKFMLGMMFSQSKHYVDNLSENIRRGQRQKAKNGIWPKMTPIGYLNDRVARVIVPDPVRGPLVRMAFEAFATGNYTLDQLTSMMADTDLTARYARKDSPQRLSRSQWHRLLRNPIYYGTFRYKGEMYEGKHEPIITRLTFDTVQAVITRRTKLKAPKRKPYLYRGLFRCGDCGCFITTETQKGHNYLRCTKRVKKECPEPYVREESIAEQIAAFVERVAVPSDWTNAMLDALQAEQTIDAKEYEREQAVLVERRRQIDQKLDRLLSAHLDGDITPEEYRAAKGRLVAEKHQLTEAEKALTHNRGNRFEPVTRFVKALQEATLLASSDDAIEKRDFIRKNGSNLKIQGKRLHGDGRGAWKLVENHGPFAPQPDARSQQRASSAGETCPTFSQAEAGGIEPPS